MENPVALITGSAKRLGAATARHLHQQGYDVVVHCHHSFDVASRLCASLNDQRQDSAKLLVADLCDPKAWQSLAEDAVMAFGRLDVLVNNASAFYPTPVGDITTDDWHILMGSNAQGPLFLSQYLQKHLARNQGVIVNMVDIHAERPLASHTVYCMAKAALVAMTRSLAIELAPQVRVNGVAPGAILWPEAPLSEQDKGDILQQIPLGSLGTPDDIARTIAFLVASPYITGQIIAVDGGRSIASASKA
ncbi:pteridine reductase [Aestuariibacter halophilus]|uniref:Pteridine reductase n=1 Tax=Fluctibacter halophilus TaxID=226011 RepID=A0ABS8G5Y3_9ALTE|nr:pteridine reductase [Aestuariibacter halophilus]MCC2615904.1 pteridine reductase [Aestuariibacter halophilus]